jgi:PAS domain S-box-containing protein
MPSEARSKGQNGWSLPGRWNVRFRQIAPVVLVLGLTVAGFFGTRALAERDARRDSLHRAEIAATEIRGRIAQGAGLAESLRRFLVGAAAGGVTNEQFANVASIWLSPVGLPAAAWVEQVPASRRAAYELRLGRRIVAADRQDRLAPVGPSASYLPATLVTGVAPMTVPGIDLAGEPRVAAAIGRLRTLYRATATPLTRLRDETAGLFLVQSAQRLVNGAVERGYLVLFVPDSWLRAAAIETERLELRVGGPSSEDLGGAAAVRSSFMEAGQQFDVLVPRELVDGPAAVLPWFVLAGGLVLAALAGALGVYAARRAKAKAEVDRIFTLSPDLIVVAGFDGYLKRVNPAFESVLGYGEQEALTRPYLEFVHPDDLEQTKVEGNRIREGQTTVSFANRYVCKNGSYRWIEWTATPVLQERLTYAVGRDVTERRQAETDLRAAEERNRTLAEAQAALRRVATLVARRVSPGDVFGATAVEAGRLLGSDTTALARYEPDGSVTVLAADTNSGVNVPIGTRILLDGDYAIGAVLRTGRAARSDSLEDATGPVAELARSWGVRSLVGAPIVVEGRVWGVMVVSSRRGPLPADTEKRLVDFTDLVATAIANTESRVALGRLVDEQAALRRVATLVAEGVPAPEVFSIVSEEVGRLLDAQATVIARLEPDGMIAIVASGGTTSDKLPVGTRLELKPGMVIAEVVREGRSARIDDDGDSPERTARIVPGLGALSFVAGPIVVEGSLWGAIAAGTESKRLPADAEQRMAKFTELAATAIANAESRSELAASRARIVAASDETRRRIERDLHDGTQQRLVSLALQLRVAESTVPPELDEPRQTIGRVAGELNGVIDELREISRGIHPAVLSEGGLRPALRTLARHSAIPVELDAVTEARLPEPIEVAAYYVVSEALANTAKHARASRVGVAVAVRNSSLQLSIRDDGVGGADAARGSGLIGLRDRVEALGGSIEISSGPGEGTSVFVELPLQLDLTVDDAEASGPARSLAGQ